MKLALCFPKRTFFAFLPFFLTCIFIWRRFCSSLSNISEIWGICGNRPQFQTSLTSIDQQLATITEVGLALFDVSNSNQYNILGVTVSFVNMRSLPKMPNAKNNQKWQKLPKMTKKYQKCQKLPKMTKNAKNDKKRAQCQKLPKMPGFRLLIKQIEILPKVQIIPDCLFKSS